MVVTVSDARTSRLAYNRQTRIKKLRNESAAKTSANTVDSQPLLRRLKRIERTAGPTQILYSPLVRSNSIIVLVQSSLVSTRLTQLVLLIIASGMRAVKTVRTSQLMVVTVSNARAPDSNDGTLTRDQDAQGYATSNMFPDNYN
eukprot:gene30200-39403_t